jgi:uncharacterized membrane protein YdcZ (DUF606 family)
MSSFFNNYFFILLAVLAGIAMPTQATVNSRLAESVNQNPVLAAFISFAVGTVALFVYIVLTAFRSTIWRRRKRRRPSPGLADFWARFCVGDGDGRAAHRHRAGF